MGSGIMIAGMTLYQIGWYFVMYSFLGWVVELTMQSRRAKSSTGAFCRDRSVRFTASECCSFLA